MKWTIPLYMHEIWSVGMWSIYTQLEWECESGSPQILLQNLLDIQATKFSSVNILYYINKKVVKISPNCNKILENRNFVYVLLKFAAISMKFCWKDES